MALDNFSTLFDLFPIGAYRSSPDGRQMRANAALVRLNGYAFEADLLAAVNQSDPQWYVEPGRGEQFRTLLQREGRVVNFVSEIYRHKTRERIWVREHAHLVRNEHGAPIYFEGTVEDITQAHVGHMQLKDSAELFCALIHTIPDLVWLKDAHGAYQACNAAFERHFGKPAADIIGKTDDDFYGNQTALRLARTDQTTFWTGQSATFEEEFLNEHGALATFEVTKAPMRNADGEIIGVMGMARDITRRKQAENLLRDTSEQFELALISAELGMWAQSFGQTPVYTMDARARAMLGLAQNEPAADNSWADWIHPDDLPAAASEVKLHLGGQSPFFEAEFRARHKSGHWVWLSGRGKVVQTSPGGEPLRMVGTLMDITERKKAEEAIRHMAFQDPLTGLPNRRLLMDRLHQALAASARHKRNGALLFLDLDRFKQLNDTRGHDVGDLLLQQVAKRIQGCVRAVDTVARIGGDEFVVLIADLSESPDYARAHAAKVGHKVLAALNEPYQLSQQRHICTSSIGAAMFFDMELTPADVLKRADMAMYEAKAKGRNMLRFYEETVSTVIG
jgi:diguanylate cyclase (GGDEF)-like protein/PAS domain S-box-containing protein